MALGPRSVSLEVREQELQSSFLEMSLFLFL